MTGHDHTDLLQTQLLQMTATKDGAYLERNRCVALIARMALAMGLRAGTARTAIEGWDEAWHGVVYIDLPTGQASWHYHDSQAHLFANLPAYTGTWDGHDTPEKYRRVGDAFTSSTRYADASNFKVAIDTMSLKPGDYVVVHSVETLRFEQRVLVARQVRSCTPEGVKVLMVDRGLRLGTLRPDEQASGAPPNWGLVLMLINEYAGYVNDAANHRAASRADLAQSLALKSLAKLREVLNTCNAELTAHPAPQARQVPKIATPAMRAEFRARYREGGFWRDRLDYALDRMLEVGASEAAKGDAP